ncbi:MAG: SPFH domain-containing protein [Candidatus Paceibacterota bacterium]|jgi:regulator of protease activity HflC (stomatin/prohibitin superfamily)
MKIKLIVGYLIANAILLLIGLGLILFKVSVDVENRFNLGFIIISLQMVYFALSCKIIGPRIKAVLVFLGNPVYEVSSGFAFVPFLFSWLEKMPGTVIQMQIPGEPEMIDRSGDDKKKLSPGMVRPIRITTGFAAVAIKNFPADKKIIMDDPLQKRMTLEVTGYIRMKVKNAVEYLKNLGSIEQLEKQVRDTFEATMNVEFGRRTPGLITTHLKEVNKALLREMKRIVEKPGWGLEVESVGLLERDITHQLNTALRDASMADVMIQTAESQKQQAIRKAEGERQKRILEGQGDGLAEQSVLEGRAKGLEKWVDLAKTREGLITLQIQLANETVQKAKYSILEPGLAGLAAGVQHTLQQIGAAGGTSKTPVTPAKKGGGGNP